MSELAERAIKVLDERGWHQGAFQARWGTGGVCALGAIGVAVCGDACNFDDTHAGEKLGNRMRELILADGWDPAGVGNGVITIVGNWNDEPSRSIEDVKLLIKRAGEEDG